MVELRLDFLGDGAPAPTVVRGDDLRQVSGLRATPPRAGTWSVHVFAVDACGREGATGVRRPVEVR